MTILEMFERVSLKIPLEQRLFFNYLNDSVNELAATYGNMIFMDDTEFTPVTGLSDENVVLPLYTGAIVDNILFLAGADQSYKVEFARKAREAYLKYWRDRAKGKILKRAGW